MPYKSEAQERFMRGCHHGMKPKGGRSCPPKKVTREFEMAEQLRNRGKKNA